jgi:hypothetical protein
MDTGLKGFDEPLKADRPATFVVKAYILKKTDSKHSRDPINGYFNRKWQRIEKVTTTSIGTTC